MSMTREEWLEARRNSIQASDVAAILGYDKRRGPISVYEAKVTGYSQDDNDWLKFGREVEGAIANLYADRTGREVSDLGATHITMHRDIPWLGATIDRVSTKEGQILNGPVELKHVGDFSRPDEWAADPPLVHQIQNQIQISCANGTWGCIAGMFPGCQLAYHDQERNDSFLETIMPELEAFWQCVQTKTPPDTDGLAETGQVLKRLYPNDSGETIALDGDEWVDLIAEMNTAKASIKNHETRKKEIQHKIKAAMQEATFAVLRDGTKITSRTVERAGYNVKPTKYRSFSVSKPKK
jgi:predicted phage-related endonuclease